MAEILVKIGDQGPSDLVFKTGDPLVIRGDGWTWGRLESKPQWIAEGNTGASWPGGFFIIKMPGTATSVVEQYIANHSDGVRLREYTIDTAGINLSNGFVVATPQQVIARISVKP